MAQSRTAPHLSPVVLIVDDDRDTREMYAEWFAFQGWTVLVASTAAEAVEKGRQFRPHVIAADIGLPGEDGCVLCKRLKDDPRTGAIPIVAVTGWATNNYVERAQQAGCDSVLVKPVLPDALLSEILRILTIAEVSRHRPG